ncbi:concanavalin A-like lectin/glucanase [Guyanagaster necrorhizus]|uniref:Concanavalin A-like lectin/glucanase n=1 Tax=Guyanagaster necrorhizus TaxID=856835 RepID=A0A9P7VSR3_9AGAR|nr:concanavalin A-like lectin/glucanase [Guyanagaster necrorhizus MCA 3950]KAG7446743.1 concanavalin A-like lectin/glucanase [Guyanagaster necrorhizus MCA 3950]
MNLLTFASAVSLLIPSALGKQALSSRRDSCDTYVLSGISGGFTEQVSVDFTSAQSSGDAANFLSQHGLSISNYNVASTPVAHDFVPANVLLGNGVLQLKVTSYSGSGSVESAEVVTDDTFAYASVRTVLKSSATFGVCEGNFFYLSDTQETDIEILTSTTLTGNDYVSAGVWMTNQATVEGGTKTTDNVEFTFDPSQDFHEYRIDWSPLATTFYIDGIQINNFSDNVPWDSGYWIWNAWSSGDPYWSNGPPTADSITEIRSIELYKGYTSTTSGTICNV